MKIFPTKYLKNIYVLVFLIFFIPRIVGLGSDIANFDSSYWHPRLDNFTKYLLRGEYKQTYQKYHPGVTMLWTSGTSKYIFRKTFEKAFNYSPMFIPHQFPKIHFASKLPLVFLISIIGVLQFCLLYKLTNKKLALIFAILLSLEPFFLGTSRFLHLSALTSMFMFLAFLLLLYHYYLEGKNNRLFYLSSIILGLGILTKIDAAIVAPINALIILFFEHKNRTKISDIIKLEFLYGTTTFAVFYILFPSMWVAPFWTLRKIINEGIKDTAFSSTGADSLSGIKFLFYPEMIVFRSLPTTVIAFIGGLLLTFQNKFWEKVKKRKIYKQILFWTIFYALFNIIMLSIPDKIKDRYLINLYPPIALVAAFWIYKIINLKNKLLKYSVIAIFSFYYLFTIYRYHPVYSFYYSDLIGGPGGREKLNLSIKNRGEYYAQAALYINKNDDNPEIRNVVLSHREQIRTFGPFFLGETFTNPKLMKDDYFADYILTRPDFDYLVSEQLADKCKLLKQFGPKDPFGYKIINLYKCNGVTNEYKNFKN